MVARQHKKTFNTHSKCANERSTTFASSNAVRANAPTQTIDQPKLRKLDYIFLQICIALSPRTRQPQIRKASSTQPTRGPKPHKCASNNKRPENAPAPNYVSRICFKDTCALRRCLTYKTQYAKTMCFKHACCCACKTNSDGQCIATTLHNDVFTKQLVPS